MVGLLAAARDKARRNAKDIAAFLFIVFTLPPLMFESKEEARKVIDEFVKWWLE